MTDGRFRPILDEFKAWFEKETITGRFIPKRDIKKAFTYTLNQWDALDRYIESGYLSMGNNLAESTVPRSMPLNQWHD